MEPCLRNLGSLTKPNLECGPSFEEAVRKLIDESGLANQDLSTLKPILESLPDATDLERFSWWNFIKLICQNLMQIYLSLKNSSEMDALLSISQTKTVRDAIEILISIGILPNLSQGIGVSIERRCTNHKLLDLSQFTDKKNICVAFILEVLLKLIEEDTLKGIIFGKYFGDLLASLFHLLLIDGKANPNFSSKREYYKEKLQMLLDNNNQPMVIRELMILNGNKRCPPKLTRALRGILTEKLMVDGGVVSTLKAILDMAGNPSSPKHWHIISVFAKLIITPHTKDVDAYYSKISPQVLLLLTSKDQVYMQISVVCIRNLYEDKPELAEKYFLKHVMRGIVEPSSEEDVTLCINTLYNCFAIPSSELWALPPMILLPHTKTLFRLYFKVFESVSHIKSNTEDITWCSFLAVQENNFEIFFDSIIFTEEDSASIFFEHGEGGGVLLTKKKDSLPIEEAADCFLSLILKRDKEGKVKVIFFKTLLKMVSEDAQELGKRAVAAKLLSVLCSDSCVLESINKDSSCVIEFLKVLIERKLDPCSFDTEIVCLGLMVLSVILGDRKSSKLKDWKQFECLVEPLKKLKDNPNNVELQILADEIYCLILSHGIIKESAQNPGKEQAKSDRMKNVKVKSEILTNLDQAIQEACDPLLPVRGHGLRQLGKLLLSGDKQAIAKKEKIMCIFKESLKDSDSYIYLSAIEGMSSLASVYPDDVLVTLAEQFVVCEEPELRLKVGEVLMRVCRLLGDMLYVYKEELLNAFLHGCKDQDQFVRASSLSNLGEMCKLLSFHLGKHVIEIFECIRCIFETDEETEPRRAAVMVLTLLIRGLGTDTFKVLESVLLQIYRKLRLLHYIEKDDITKLHIQLAIEELDNVTKAYLFPEQSFSKRIYVLDAPP